MTAITASASLQICPGALNVGTVRRQLRQRFGNHSDTVILDGDLLLCHVLSCSREQLYAAPEAPVSEEQYEQWMTRVRCRLKGMPLAYLLERKEFYGLTFRVTPDVLIPRPETETLVEAVAALLSDARCDGHRRQTAILELGTGCGAVAITLAKKYPQCAFLATDISAAALAIARQNAADHRVNNVRFILSDWFQAFPGDKTSGDFDFIVSNPPYVAIDDPDLTDDVARYEPALSLFAGEQGLDCLDEIIRNASRYLTVGGYVAVEHGRCQSDAVAALIRDTGLDYVKSVNDASGYARVAVARLPFKK